jgi:hypothetical protein
MKRVCLIFVVAFALMGWAFNAYGEEKRVGKLDENEVLKIENEMAMLIIDLYADIPFTEQKALVFAVKTQAIRTYLSLWIGDIKKENTAYDEKDKFLKRLEAVVKSLEEAEKMAKEAIQKRNWIRLGG